MRSGTCCDFGWTPMQTVAPSRRHSPPAPVCRPRVDSRCGSLSTLLPSCCLLSGPSLQPADWWILNQGILYSKFCRVAFCKSVRNQSVSLLFGLHKPLFILLFKMLICLYMLFMLGSKGQLQTIMTVLSLAIFGPLHMSSAALGSFAIHLSNPYTHATTLLACTICHNTQNLGA